MYNAAGRDSAAPFGALKQKKKKKKEKKETTEEEEKEKKTETTEEEEEEEKKRNNSLFVCLFPESLSPDAEGHSKELGGEELERVFSIFITRPSVFLPSRS